MPAHASSWGKAYPQLTIQCSGHQTLLDPTDTDDFNVYQVFDGLMKEFDPLFNSSSFFHIGGDEVRDTYCWEHSDKVQSWMKTKGMTTVHEVRQYFEDRVQKIVRQNKRTPILWEEVYDDGYHIDKTTIVNAWLGSVVRNVTADGLKLIYNYGMCVHIFHEEKFSTSLFLCMAPINIASRNSRLVSRSAESTWRVTLFVGGYLD